MIAMKFASAVMAWICTTMQTVVHCALAKCMSEEVIFKPPCSALEKVMESVEDMINSGEILQEPLMQELLNRIRAEFE